MNFTHVFKRKLGNAVCYSGYREGQSPVFNIFPTYEQIKEDLLIVTRYWDRIRLYDCSPHAETTLEVILKEKINLKVMLGTELAAEINNPNCPWGDAIPEQTLIANQTKNLNNIKKMILLANRYPEIIEFVSAGNEATVDWTDHLVPVEKVVSYVRKIRSEVRQPVTFCENYVPWNDKLKELVDVVDFISIHTYPVWEFKGIDESLDYTKANYYGVAEKYPHKLVVITEAGWTTRSNGRGMPSENANEEFAAKYHQAIKRWKEECGILIYEFEAFDESWKGSDDALEPEKHWGHFYEDRRPKKYMRDYTVGSY